MKSSQQRTKPIELVPLFTENEIRETVLNIPHLMSPYYSAEREKRHLDASQMIKSLYQTGATLINSNRAYSFDPDQLSITNDEKNTFSEDKIQNIHDKLIQQYNHLSLLPDNNPLRALFIIKVALDNLPKENIIAAHAELEESQKGITMARQAINFPNGDQLDGATAASIFNAYIIYNFKNRFSFLPDLPEKEKRKYQIYNYYDADIIRVGHKETIKAMFKKSPFLFEETREKTVTVLKNEGLHNYQKNFDQISSKFKNHLRNVPFTKNSGFTIYFRSQSGPIPGCKNVNNHQLIYHSNDTNIIEKIREFATKYGINQYFYDTFSIFPEGTSNECVISLYDKDSWPVSIDHFFQEIEVYLNEIIRNHEPKSQLSSYLHCLFNRLSIVDSKKDNNKENLILRK